MTKVRIKKRKRKLTKEMKLKMLVGLLMLFMLVLNFVGYAQYNNLYS